MRYPLDALLDPESRQHRALLKMGISDTDQLLTRLGRCRWSTRQEVFGGLASEEIDRLLAQADLLRVRGIRPATAGLLAMSGVRSVQDLAKKQPTELLTRIGNRISPEALNEMVDEAKELRVRVYQTPRVARDFEAHVAQMLAVGKSSGVKFDSVIVPFVIVVLVAVFFLAGGAQALMSALLPYPSDAGLSGAYRQLEFLTVSAAGAMVAVLFVTLVTAYVVTIAGGSLVNRLLARHVLPRFLVTDEDRLCLVDFHNSVSRSETVRGYWIGAGLAVVMVLLMLSLFSGASLRSAVRGFVGLQVVAAPLVIGALFSTFSKRLARLKDSMGHQWSSLRRVAQWQLVQVIALFVFLLGAASIVFPTAIRATHVWSAKVVLPVAERRASATTRLLRDRASGEDELAAIQDYEEVVHSRFERMTDLSVDGVSLRDMAEAITSVVVVWFGWIVVVGLILPYGKHYPRRTLMYFGLIFLGAFIESGLETSLDSVFRTGPIENLVVLALIVLATDVGTSWVHALEELSRG